MDAWDPARLRTLHSVMDRCAPFLAEGAMIRRGMEGDPLYPYGPDDPPPTGTVTHVFRGAGGVQFDLRFADGTTSRMTTTNVSPTDVWEVDPEFVDTYRGIIETAMTPPAAESKLSEDAPKPEGAPPEGKLAEGASPEGASPEGASPEGAMPEDVYRGEVETRFGTLQDRLALQEEENHTFRGTIRESIRHIASDLIKLSRGESLEFCPEYMDRYDRVDGGGFRGARKSFDKYQGEKFASITYAESELSERK